MLSYVTNFFYFLFNKNNNDLEDHEKETFLAQELLDLDLQAEKETKVIPESPVREVPRNAICFQKKGVITDCGDGYALIDGSLYFDTTGCTLNLNTNDEVLYLGYNDDNGDVRVVRILENQGLYWGDGEVQSEEQTYNVIEHILIGQVEKRQDRYVYIAESDLKFNLDEVGGPFVPIKGDWLELKCSVQQDSEKLSNITPEQVLKVIHFNPLRKKIKSATVTDSSQNDGICDGQIYYDVSSLIDSTRPNLGSKVLVDAIESSQGSCTWRALKLIVLDEGSPRIDPLVVPNEETISLDLEKQKNIDVTYPVKFDKVYFQQTETITLNITNKSNQVYVINKWIILSKKRDSQINIKPFIHQPVRLESGQTFQLKISCNPKFLGKSKECLVVLFKGFQFKRFININVVEDNNSKILTQNGNKYWKESHKMDAMRKIRYNNDSVIVGMRPYKTPHFVAVKIGQYPIPEKIWAIVLGDSEQMVYTNEFDKVLNKIENHLPFLSRELSVTNYIDKWHTLLYMEEVQANLNMRVYDKSKVYLLRCDEYLGIEIEGLSEGRPSLIRGDMVIVKDIWTDNDSKYEGYIHNIKGDLVLIKFNPHFHESYKGDDVSIEFHFHRTTFRRAHHALSLALSNLGKHVLFPSHIVLQEPQIPKDNIERVIWFNNSLNDCQRDAILNIIKGECRPLPYVIFGPPGTGKTMTVIETILQILTLIPESRILVATPSNSASNLITERLINYKDHFSGSVVRLIADYLIDSENIPEIIRPYCATLDVAVENTSKSKHAEKNNMQLHCQKSYIGRHRVTIGTCYCLGSLFYLGLPKGHFTHVIIDEAGQATEPEIMVPMTFIDKNNGHIILAGDPMQLGPIILSKYCKEFGMDESFLCRLLERFPYLKDYASFKNGFDNRLVTRLNDNYRSLQEVISLPSEMFYDGSLVAKIDKGVLWSHFINAVNEVLELQTNSGGIFVYGIKGTNLRSDESPSWYNPQEAAMLALTVCKLYKKNIKPDDIGVITPYIAQTKYFRILFESMGLPEPKIGTVEEFQGQERPIILISTVRSNNSLLQEDVRHSLGFVKSPKRLNVALTRAQIAVILFCNPHLLSLDPLWKKVIVHAVSSDKYLGCDLPLDYAPTFDDIE